MEQPTASIFAPTTASPTKTKALTITAHVARVILGLLYLVFGLNKFLQFISMLPPEGLAGEFLFGLSKGPYMFPLIGLIEVVGGALLLFGSLVPFALLLVFPITLNIFLYHLTLAPENMGLTIFMLVANIFLAVYYWHAYRPLFNSGNAWKSNNTRHSF